MVASRRVVTRLPSMLSNLDVQNQKISIDGCLEGLRQGKAQSGSHLSSSTSLWIIAHCPQARLGRCSCDIGE